MNGFVLVSHLVHLQYACLSCVGGSHYNNIWYKNYCLLWQFWAGPKAVTVTIYTVLSQVRCRHGCMGGLSCAHHILLWDLLPLPSMRRDSKHLMHWRSSLGQEEECLKKVIFKKYNLILKPKHGHTQQDCSKSKILLPYLWGVYRTYALGDRFCCQFLVRLHEIKAILARVMPR